MSIIRNPEYRGVAILLLVILAMGLVLAAATGKLSEWTGISFGPKALNKIIFVSDASGTAEICVMNPNGKGRKQLTAGAMVRSAPAISPRGDRIVYVGRYERTDQVFSIGAEGGTPEQLTSATGSKKEPRFTPDGKHLSFIASGRVYVADTNGDSPHPVLPTSYEIRAAMSDPLRRGEVPAYFDYAWGPDSEMIIGVRKDPDGNDSAVFIAGHDALPKVINSPELPWAALLNELLKREGAMGRRIAPDDHVRIAGVDWAEKVPGFAITAVSGNDGFVIVFGVDKGELKLGGFKSFRGRKLGRPALAPDGSAVAIPVSATDGSREAGLINLDLATNRAQVVASGMFDRPGYSAAGDRILATLVGGASDADPGSDSPPATGRQTRYVVVVELATGDVKRLTGDGGSYDAIWSPVMEK